MRRVGFCGMLLSFVQVCKMITKESRMTRCVGFCGMLLSFVTSLQDDYKRESHDEMYWVLWDATVFCNKFAR